MSESGSYSGNTGMDGTAKLATLCGPSTFKRGVQTGQERFLRPVYSIIRPNEVLVTFLELARCLVPVRCVT